MCGIAGTYSRPGEPPVQLETLRSMIAAVAHRGPDGHGLYRDERVGLAHARLSVIDLDGGAQPLANEDGSIWLSFNGEIFNYVELRRELAARGHRLRTRGDAEVIVHLYEELGPAAWLRLNGQFAFCLWDRTRGLLHLVRDRFGILPLHYATTGRAVLFASEVKALLVDPGVRRGLDPGALVETFTRWSVAAPRTAFEGVRSVRPGCSLVVDRDLRITEERYWDLSFDGSESLARADPRETSERLGERLAAAVRLRLRADVPVGAYLSGGLDSAVVASLVRDVHPGGLETFAIGFDDAAYDETESQRRMASWLGTAHHEESCSALDIARALPDVVWHCEAPLLRTAPVPLYRLSALVRSQGMKVVLTGEGADELLGGYGIFKEDRIRRFWARDPGSTMRPALLGRVHTEVEAERARGSALWSRFFAQGLDDTEDPGYSHRIRWSNTAWSRRVLHPELRGAAEPVAPFDDLPARWGEWDPLARAQWLEIRTFLEPYLLAFQGDRVAMAHGVEVRYPYLDPDVVELCSALPSWSRMVGLRDKVALRRLAAGRLPVEIVRRPKQPYRAPMVAPFLDPGAGTMLEDVLAPQECRRLGLLDERVATQLVAKARRVHGRLSEREEMALVGMVTLQMLGRTFGEDLDGRLRDARRRLEASTPLVLEDRLVGAVQP